MSSIVRAMEMKPLSDKISAASRTVSEGKGEEKEKRERRMREMKSVEEAINGGCVCLSFRIGLNNKNGKQRDLMNGFILAGKCLTRGG